MTGMVKVHIYGTICSDIQESKTNTGKSVAKFSIAVNRYKKETVFINCIAWEAKADFIGKYFKKGNKIVAVGDLDISKYEKDGQTKTYTSVIIGETYFVDNKSEQSSGNDDDFASTLSDNDLPWEV